MRQSSADGGVDAPSGGKTLGKELVKMILAEMLASGPWTMLFALL